MIPRAIDWFTGEALAFEELDEDDFDEDDFDDDEDDDDLSDDRDEDEESDEDDVRLPNAPPRLYYQILTIYRMMAPSLNRRLLSASRAKCLTL